MSTSAIPWEVSPSDAAELLKRDASALLLDCRTPDEHATARIAGSVLIPMQEIEARINELAGREDDMIVVHCHHGVRSLRVTAFLRQRGFENAVSMAGGIDRWSLEVDPAVPRY